MTVTEDNCSFPGANREIFGGHRFPTSGGKHTGIEKGENLEQRNGELTKLEIYEQNSSVGRE